MKSDVLIVGAGPVGLTLASELARYGASVRIVDKNAARTDKSKAIVVWARSLELMDRMGGGLSDRFVQAGLKAESANILSGRETIAHVDLTAVNSPYKFVLLIPQTETERLMEEHLATFGVVVQREVELTAFHEKTDRIIGSLSHADGKREAVEASWVVGCDGAHSTVRHLLEMEFQGSTMLSDWVLADVHLSGISGPPSINIFWHAHGVLALFPLGGTRYRVIADIGESSGSIGEGHRPTPTLEDVQRLINERGPQHIQTSDPVWLSSFSISERKVADYRLGNAFLAGDAAHVHSPAGGQGMNTGIQDACNLAWKLALAVRALCTPEPLLDSYSIERSSVAKLVLEVTGRATAMAVLKGGIKQSIRNHMATRLFGFAPVKHAMENVLSELSIGYPESPLNAYTGHAHGGYEPGKRAPIRPNESPVGSGDTPRFVICADANDAFQALLESYGAVLEPALRPPLAPGGIWLIRPDGYVALSAPATNWDAVDSYLAHLCR